MRIATHWLRRQVAVGLLLLLATPFLIAAPSQQPETDSGQQAESPSTSSSIQTQSRETDTLPNSPGEVRSQTVASNQQQQVSGQQPPQQQQQNPPSEPVGTAAAEYVKTTGVAASQPAGAAIAPAKQRRARSILIKVGAIVGAGVAIGTVAALSAASPSRPSH